MRTASEPADFRRLLDLLKLAERFMIDAGPMMSRAKPEDAALRETVERFMREMPRRLRMIRDAQSILPELGEAVLEDVSTGLRPGSPDNAPIVGQSGLAGLIHATGHYRNGILLAAVTADGVAELITTGLLPDGLTPFAPERFRQVVSA